MVRTFIKEVNSCCWTTFSGGSHDCRFHHTSPKRFHSWHCTAAGWQQYLVHGTCFTAFSYLRLHIHAYWVHSLGLVMTMGRWLCSWVRTQDQDLALGIACVQALAEFPACSAFCHLVPRAGPSG